MRTGLLVGFMPLLALALILSVPAPAAQVQASAQDGQASTLSPRRQSSNIAKPLTDKQRKRQADKLRKELESPYKNWLSEEVGYIITDEERKTFNRLETDEEREQFVEQFWLRRDPTPDTEENEYREEHYRRIAYANERFASGIQGWKTDRGMIYIKYGPPDAIEGQSNGGVYERPYSEGGGTTSAYPFEQWRYRYIEGIGSNIVIEFVDPTMTGEFHMTMDPSEKDALLEIPGAGLTEWEQMGFATKTQRFERSDGTHLGNGPVEYSLEDDNEFSRLNQFAKLQGVPAIKYKDLEAAVNSTIKYNLLPMKVRADFIPITDSSVLSNITFQFDRKDLQFKDKEGVSSAIVNIYGRITSMSRRTVNSFEDVVTVDVPSSMLQESIKGSSLYQKQVPLQPGRYRLTVVAKDLVGGNTTRYEMVLEVPRIEDEHLAASTLILADLIEKVPTKSIGTGAFVIGTAKVRPRIDETFRRDQKLGIYVQLYNFEPDEKTKKPRGRVQYEIFKNGSNQRVFDLSEDLTAIPGGAAQLVVTKLLPLKDLEPGQYTLKLSVVDTERNQSLTPSATFTVTGRRLRWAGNGWESY